MLIVSTDFITTALVCPITIHGLIRGLDMLVSDLASAALGGDLVGPLDLAGGVHGMGTTRHTTATGTVGVLHTTQAGDTHTGGTRITGTVIRVTTAMVTMLAQVTATRQEWALLALRGLTKEETQQLSVT